MDDMLPNCVKSVCKDTTEQPINSMMKIVFMYYKQDVWILFDLFNRVCVYLIFYVVLFKTTTYGF